MSKKNPNPTDKHVGSRVRMRRMMIGMSQEKLGDALNLTFQQVQKYEKGTNRIGSSRLQQIAVVLKVPVSFFFEGLPDSGTVTGPDQATVALNAALALPGAIDMVLAYQKAPLPVRNATLALLEAYNAQTAPT